MRIDKLRVRNFQGIEEADLQLAALTLIYGPNGAGKTTIAEAILHALTAAKLREGTLGELIRQGAKSMEVEVHLAGAAPGQPGFAITRRRTKSAGESFVNGVEVKEAEAAKDLAKQTKLEPQTVAAALQSGHLLHLGGKDLLALLAGLTGAKCDAKAIAAEFGGDVVQAAGRARLQLPTALDGFADACKRAEGARQAAKRQLAEREADLARLPALLPAMSPAEATAALSALRTRRDAALRSTGAQAGKAEATAARLAELSALQPPAGDPAATLRSLEADQRRVASELATLKADGTKALEAVKDAARKLDALPPCDPAAMTDEECTAAVAEGMADAKALETARAALAVAKARGIEAAAALAAATGHDCGRTCESHCPDLKALVAAREGLLVDYREADATIKAINARVEARRLRTAAAERAALAAAGEKWGKAAAAALDEHAALSKTSEKLEAEAVRLRADATQAQRYTDAQKEIARLSKPAPAAAPVEDVAQLDVETEAAQAALDAHAVLMARGAAEAALRQAEAAVADADQVAQACGAKGVRTKLIARAAGPFLAAANGALGRLAEGTQVDLDTDGELGWIVRRGKAVLRPAQLSEGERWRLRSVLQYAASQLAGVGLLVLDGAEVLDEAGSAAIKRLVGGWVQEGLQVVLLSCKAPPGTVPPGVTAYLMTAGRAARIAEARAA